jgi:ankyrin repeat protein
VEINADNALMIRAGADIHARDHNGETPRDLARKATRKTTMTTLITLAAGNKS